MSIEAANLLSFQCLHFKVEEVLMDNATSTPTRGILTLVSGGSSESEVDPNRLRPHPRYLFIYGEDEDFASAIESIRRYGIIERLILTPSNLIVKGYSHWKAALQLGLALVPVAYRSFPDEIAELEALLVENASRPKTTEQKIREAMAWEDIERLKARERQIKLAGTRPHGKSDLQVNLPEGEKGQTRDQVAKRVGLKGSNYERGAKVVNAIDDAAGVGDSQTAKALRVVLNLKSVNAAYQLLKKPQSERDAISGRIASSEVKTTSGVRALLDAGKFDADGMRENAHHLQLKQGGLVDVLKLNRTGRIAKVCPHTVDVWMRNLDWMTMECHTFKHHEVEPLPSEQESMPEVRSRIASLLDKGGLDPIELDILNLLERPVVYTPAELDYLTLIEQRHL